MPDDFDSVGVFATTDPAALPSRQEVRDDLPFHILVVGDFSGRGSGSSESGERPIGPFAVDDVDELMGRLRPFVQANLEGVGRVEVAFREMEDFHPDRLVKSVPHLRMLKDSIGPLVADHRRGAASALAESGGESTDPPPTGLLDEIVESAPTHTESSTSGPLRDLEPWIRDVVTPHLVVSDDSEQRELRAVLEGEVRLHLRRLLQSEEFRARESLWRSLLFLRVATAPYEGVRIHVLDVPREFVEAAAEAPDPEDSPLRHLLEAPVHGARGPVRYALAVGNFGFGASLKDVMLLNRLALGAHLAEVPLLVDGQADIFGVDRFDAVDSSEGNPQGDFFDALRETPASSSILMAAPRFLLRMPYGPGTEPCDDEEFEEFELIEGSARGHYVWGGASFAVAASLAASFGRDGWSLRTDLVSDLEAPAVVTATSQARATEAIWSGDQIDHVRERGIVALSGYKHQSRMRLQPPVSLSRSDGELAAWWKS